MFQHSIFDPPAEGSFFERLAPLPVRHFHPDKQKLPVLHVSIHILDTKDFEVFLMEVVPFLEHELQTLQDPQHASFWGHAVGDDGPNFTQATWKEVRDNYQAQIPRSERMGPDYMLGTRAGQTAPMPSCGEYTKEQDSHRRALLQINGRFDITGATPLGLLSVQNEAMIGLCLLNPPTLLSAIQLSPFAHLFQSDPSENFLVQGSSRYQMILIIVAILLLDRH